MARSRAATRKRILDAAYGQFRQKGYSRVGVDEVAAAAGITKRTLYDHIGSKDGLLQAVLEEQADMAFAAFQTFGRRLVGTPEDIVRIFFAELLSWSSRPGFPGSGFTRLAMELADLPGHPARRIASRHKQALEGHLAQVLAEAGVHQAEELARQLFILAEGVMALTLIHGQRHYCTAGEAAALALISASSGGHGGR